MTTDIVVVGGGAAGMAAAREARRRDRSVTIVSDGPLGGDCTFTGCVPSKTVIEAAHRGESFAEAFDRARRVVDQIASTEDADVFRREGIDVVDGRGSLVGDRIVEVGGQRIEASKGIVLALGAVPVVPPIPGLEDADPLTSETLWSLTDKPSSMAIIGAGAIGCELSQALAGLGVSVTLIEMMDRVLSAEEPLASAVVEDALKGAGVEVRLGSGVVRVDKTPDGAEIALDDGSVVTAERVLMAVGRRPNTAGLDSVDVDDRGFVIVDGSLQTSRKGVYAAGDVTAEMAFTHAADYGGRMAAANILKRFGRQRFRAGFIPRVTFTSPEVASIGFTEAEAATEVKGAMVAELPLSGHDRAVIAGRTDGFIKLIAGPRPVLGSLGGGRIVGATIVADRAGEMIAELALHVRLDAFTGRLAQTVHPYPTWSYAIAKAAGQFFMEVEGRRARPAQVS